MISPLVDLIIQKTYSNTELINQGFEEKTIIEIKNKIHFNEYKRILNGRTKSQKGNE